MCLFQRRHGSNPRNASTFSLHSSGRLFNASPFVGARPLHLVKKRKILMKLRNPATQKRPRSVHFVRKLVAQAPPPCARRSTAHVLDGPHHINVVFHNRLLRAFPWDQPHHLDGLFQKLKHIHILLGGPLLHSVMRSQSHHLVSSNTWGTSTVRCCTSSCGTNLTTSTVSSNT